jgi:soluble lytic murein transglycosylase-like protein
LHRLSEGETMSGNGSARQGRAYYRRQSVAGGLPACFPRRAANIVAGASLAALLGACSSPAPLVADAGPANNTMTIQPVATALSHQAYAASVRAARAAIATGKPKRMPPTTARQILDEWGAAPFAPGPFQPGRPAGLAGTRTALVPPQPDLSLSLQEIMANAVCHACEAKPYHKMVLHASQQNGVPASLIHAVIQKESGYNPAATSKRNARGLMQVTAGTARRMGLAKGQSLYDPQTNINIGTAYLKYLMHGHGTVDEVLAAYNSGPGNVRKYHGVPPFSETRRYVSDVKRFYAYTSSGSS